MQQSNRPIKPILPIAQNDASKAAIPTTSADDTRASQSLGFPPLTGQPPEAGGVPPQLADMNGLLYLLSGIDRWVAAGGKFPFDAAFAGNANINGYMRGAVLQAQDALGDFISTAEDNSNNPDTSGANWVPGYHYGAAGVSGLTGGTVTLTQAQAAKRVVTLGGTLTSNLVVVVPAWRYDWTFYNVTAGTFTVTVRTAGGSGVVIPNNGAPTPVLCDGNDCTLLSANIAPATSSSQAMQLGQAGGRLLNIQRFASSGTYTPTAGTTRAVVTVVGGGGGGGGCSATGAGQTSLGVSGGGGGFAIGLVNVTGPVPVTVGTGGAGGTGAAAGQNGGTSAFATLGATGGAGGATGAAVTPVTATGGTGGGSGTGGNIANGAGSSSLIGLHLNATTAAAGGSGGSLFGGSVTSAALSSAGATGGAPGAGGSGAVATQNQIARDGGAGAAGVVIIEEYA